MWDGKKVNVDFVDANVQSITVKITLPGKPTWLFSAIYASPTPTVRSMLWNCLDNLILNHDLPWVLMGDFNELVSSSDKNCGSLNGRFGGLCNWINRNAMLDLGFVGSCYTWTNNRIKERLDRSFCNCSWRTLFPDAFIRHLPRTRSDHCPILLQLYSNNVVNRQAIPFKFQAMWMTHEDYP